MRIIDYYNYIAMAAYILIGVAALCIYKRGKRVGGAHISDRLSTVLFIIILVVASALRLYKLGTVPFGLQQDEASIGYDAYTLANFGIDRNGYSWPVYPITWGCGGGSPLLIYLNVITIKLFGTGIVKLRLIPAVLGIATVLLLYLTLKIMFTGMKFRNEISLLGAFFLAVAPWHVIQSRWSLDSNIMPFNMMLPVYLFMLAVKKRSTLIYCLSAAAFAVCMYSYGSATIVVPLFLVMICIYCIANKSLTVLQTVFAGITFMVVFAPLLWFYAINYLGFPEVVTPFFCLNKFTAARTGEAFISLNGSFIKEMTDNLRSFLLAMSVGDSAHTIAHYLPGYASLYEFTFPITMIGAVISFVGLRKRTVGETKEFIAGNAVFTFLAVSSAVLALFIVPDINRYVMAFIPFIYFFIRGAGFVIDHSKKLFIALAGILIVASASFARDYFNDYNSWTISIFMPGYGDAITRAYEIAGDDRTIYSTYEGLSSPFMLALYYNEYDPYKFYTTVEYKDPEAEFRIAKSFGNFVFELPEDVNDKAMDGDVFVIASSELELFNNESGYIFDDFGGYFVVHK